MSAARGCDARTGYGEMLTGCLAALTGRGACFCIRDPGPEGEVPGRHRARSRRSGLGSAATAIRRLRRPPAPRSRSVSNGSGAPAKPCRNFRPRVPVPAPPRPMLTTAPAAPEPPCSPPVPPGICRSPLAGQKRDTPARKAGGCPVQKLGNFPVAAQGRLIARTTDTAKPKPARAASVATSNAASLRERSPEM